MIPSVDLQRLKQRLSSRLLNINGVTGLGIPGGKLTVYLAEDSDLVKRDVAAVLAVEAPALPIAYVTTGPFRPH